MFPDSFADNVADSLRRMGHDVDALGSTSRTNRSRVGAILTQLAQGSGRATLAMQHRTIARATRKRYDLVITVESTLAPEAVDRIKRNGSAVAVWFPDPVSALGRQVMFMCDYDVICLKDSEMVRRGQVSLTTKVIYLPEACNPTWHRPSEVPMEPVVVFAGNMYPLRMRLLERLSRAGLPLRIYGPPWAGWLRSDVLAPHSTGRYLAREEKARVFRSAGVVLNTLQPGEMASVNCRLFEAAGCGAATLTDARPDLWGLFEVSTEVATFETFDELVDQARWLLDHPDMARAMGDRAATRAHAEHTYDHRLSRLLTIVS
jgi:spore maturation protein CgeB